MITETRAFEGGYCRQLLALIDRRSWLMVKFQAVYLALRHSREGWALVDTGYSDQFATASRRFPQRFYRWATPATTAGTTTEQLARAGIRADEVRHVIITHFHADHVGGLAEFPRAQIHYHAEALDTLQRLSAFHQVRGAFLSGLVPAWLPQQARPVAPDAFAVVPDLPFAAHDLFGDGSVRLVALPGHAPGQVGVVFTSSHGPELYAADAFWCECQLAEQIEPFALAMLVQWDSMAYRKTVAQLREVYRTGHYRLTACHQEGAASRLNLLSASP